MRGEGAINRRATKRRTVKTTGTAQRESPRSRFGWWLFGGLLAVAALGGYLVVSRGWVGNGVKPAEEEARPLSLQEVQVLHHREARLSEAEQGYRSILESDPMNPVANQELATLLGLCGRREEAKLPIARLIAQGRAEELLLLVARDRGVLNDPSLLQRGSALQPPDALALLGIAWQEGDQGGNLRAIELLRQAIELQPDLTAAHAELGAYLLLEGKLTELAEWQQRLPKDADNLPQIWLVRGEWAEALGQVEGAVRCYAEAAWRSPELKVVNAKLAQLLTQVNEEELAKAFADYSDRLRDLSELQDRVFFASEPSGPEVLLGLIERYENVGRYWEAYAWAQLALDVAAPEANVRGLLSRLQQKLSLDDFQFVDQQVSPIYRLDRRTYSLPQLGTQPPRPNSESATESSDDQLPLVFAAHHGDDVFSFEYFNGTDGEPQRRMYEFSGGGIGVLDYDLDGWPDAMFSQGCRWPPPQESSNVEAGPYRDRLQRNIDGRQYVDVPQALQEQQVGFGQGVAAGDFNADGFPDIYVANAGGVNRLYRNNGDGTFADVTAEVGLSGSQWTTSCAIIDLNADGFPDIFDVNYVKGEDVFDRVCVDDEGHPAICMPFDFDAEADVVWINDGQGGFADQTATLLGSVPNGKGLGIAAAELDGSGRLSVVVANDTTPNHLWIPQVKEDGSVQLIDRGALNGIALNEAGKAEGSMGIAVADIDGNGQQDMLVTNFLYESNTLYLGREKAFFVDATRQLGIQEPSMNVLGFGTQFLDVDLDGQFELFVTNGHIDDLQRRGRPYRMPAQLFRFRGRRYQLVSAALVGDYFTNDWLGRGVARLDWNRDGLPDLFVGHLRDPSALLVNQTATTQRAIVVRLVGTESCRDAIGAEVKLLTEQGTKRQQLTAGDGYQASNERTLTFGVDAAARVEGFEVRWPGGKKETISFGQSGCEVSIIEGRGVIASRPLR